MASIAIMQTEIPPGPPAPSTEPKPFPVEEPDPDRLPDEDPKPNPDETNPPQQASRASDEALIGS